MVTSRRKPGPTNKVRITNIVTRETLNHKKHSLAIGNKDRELAMESLASSNTAYIPLYHNDQRVGYLIDGPESPEFLQVRILQEYVDLIIATTSCITLHLIGDGSKQYKALVD